MLMSSDPPPNGASSDPRIPVRCGTAASAGSTSYILNVAELPLAAAGRHQFGCACCTPRGALARALGRLFVAQARGEIPPFQEVVIVGSNDTLQLAEEIMTDIVASARFRPTI